MTPARQSLSLSPLATVTAAAAAKSQKLCKLLPDFDIYGYKGLELGLSAPPPFAKPKKLFVAPI